MKRMHVITATLFFLCMATTVMAQRPGAQLSHSEVTATGAGVRITIAGVWPDSCIPGAPVIEREGGVIRLHMNAPGGGCFAAFRPWQHAVVVSGLSAGNYEVVVSYELQSSPGPRHEMGAFSFGYPIAQGGPVMQSVPVGGLVWSLLASALMLAVAGGYVRRGSRTL